ncbi:rap guanine nucleotide exchange factor 4-like [Photinus pyralis]|uniref:rap guanine nucleotide exchange factor 4-like n=1 Tax=Photinus pyralis TaxID=7054 RepID=UPI00126714A5|nr:rap guanine nucleotide exchange factor 4-like [Photinus pyralis]
MEWITAIDKRPCDRNVKDVELIATRLRRVEQLYKLPNSVLQQLALCGYYEDLEKGVTLFRQGDTGKCWYAVMGGILDVRITQPEADAKVPLNYFLNKTLSISLCDTTMKIVIIVINVSFRESS